MFSNLDKLKEITEDESIKNKNRNYKVLSCVNCFYYFKRAEFQNQCLSKNINIINPYFVASRCNMYINDTL